MRDLIVGMIAGYEWTTPLSKPITKINYHDEGGYTIHQNKFVCSCGRQDLEANRAALLEEKQKILDAGSATLRRLQESKTPLDMVATYEIKLGRAKEANQRALDENLKHSPCNHWCPKTYMLKTDCPCHNKGCGRVEPFVVSLRRSGYNGRCILITGNDSVGADILSKYDVETYDLGLLNEHPFHARPRATIKIMEQEKLETRYILAVDTRDIIFQSNPLTWVENNIGNHSLIITTEGGTHGGDSSSSQENAKRTIATYGEEEYQRMKNFPICNGGVLAGTPQTMIDFRKAVLAEMDKFPNGTPGYGTREEGWPSEQVVMNYLLSKEPFRSQTLIVEPTGGFAFCRQHVYNGATVRNNIFYPPGSDVPYSIIHQYLEWSSILWPMYSDEYQIVFKPEEGR